MSGGEEIQRRRIPVLGAMVDFLEGSGERRCRYVLTRWAFLRLLGAVYLIAFLSLWVQVDGLIGSRGILPAGDFIEGVRGFAAREGLGIGIYIRVPTLCHLSASDGFLHFLAGGGAALSLLLILGAAPVPVLALLWLFYLSLATVCQDFLSFQWDILLLESGFLAIFLAPMRPLSTLRGDPEPPLAVIWLLRWLLFRLMFASGVVKLTYGDPTWWDLTALTVHYETQPIPHWASWHVHQMPVWFQKISCLGMYAGEIAAPIFIFAPRRWRLLAFFSIIALQAVIGLTGNYGFFNLLGAVLCIPLLDDGLWPRFLRGRVGAPRPRPPFWRRWPGPAVIPLALAILAINAVDFHRDTFNIEKPPPGWMAPALALSRWEGPFRTVNSYGLFRVMTTSRPEIVIEGSDDEMTWLPYEFRWKPGDLGRAPGIVQPHMPRLDWQMWFAALRPGSPPFWFRRLLLRLLEGSEEVEALLEKNPFPEKPPRTIRAVLYNYRFTDPETRRRDGTWWRREELGIYFPPVRLRS